MRFAATRGYTYAAILCDEVAFWRSRRDVAQSRCRNSARAAAGPGDDTGRDAADGVDALIRSAASFTTLIAVTSASDDARVLVWKASTLEMNPSIDKRIIDEAYEDDPESAKAEYGGEFRTDLADFVSRETVDAVTMWDRPSCRLSPA